LREKNFDTVLCAHRSLRSAALLKMAGIPFRVGFSNSAFPWLFNARVPRDLCRHEVERNLALLAPLGGPPQDFDARLEMGVNAPAPEVLADSNGRKKIGICPGSIWTTKRWPPQKFGEAAKVLGEERNADVYLLGSEEDREAADMVAEAAGIEVRNLAGATTLAEWTAAMSKMDLIITNDSAPTHIASALQVPVVVIFGPTTPRQGFAPWLNRSRTVEVRLPCRPCGEHGARRCPEGHFKCMELIEAEQVVGAARSLLEEG
jgi:heptosyltransferase-2